MTDDNFSGQGHAKRKLALDDKSKKKRRQEKQRRLNCGPSSGRVPSRERTYSDDRNLPSRQTKTRKPGSGTRSVSPNPNCEISSGKFYQLDKNALISECPASFAYLRTVQVEEKTRSHVLVTFPSASALKACFGKDPSGIGAAELKTGFTAADARSPRKDSEGERGPNKGAPELDENFTMTPKLAEKILVRAVSGTEYGKRAHHWNFWVIDDFKNRGENFVSDDSRSSSLQLEINREGPGEGRESSPPDSPREVGAIEALMLLMPEEEQNSMNSSDGSQTAKEESAPCKPRSNRPRNGLPTRSTIKWGVRSLRKTNSVNHDPRRDRHCENNSPASAARSAAASSADRRDRRRVDVSCKKSLDYSESQRTTQARRTPESKNATELRQVKVRQAQASVPEGNSVKLSINEKVDKAVSKQSRSNNILKLPKDMRGRWASERYTSAQLKLIDIMHERGAVPGKPILRPVLREEARKDIGDTGLLDHLLKHMTDTVVTNGERFRRRHNAAGAMEYWLEDASYMDMRIAAGIDDPFWIPPPGWKPGDRLSNTGGYDIHVEMTPAEAAEMTNLKKSVDKLKKRLSSLVSNVKKTWNSIAFGNSQDEVGPFSQECQPQEESSCVRTKHNNDDEDVEDATHELNVRSRITSEIKCIREELHKVSEGRVSEKKDSRRSKELKSKTNDKKKREVCQPIFPEDWIGQMIEVRLQNIELEVQKLSEEERDTRPSVTATKNQLEGDLQGLRLTVNHMEEDVLDVTNKLGLSVFTPQVHQLGMSTESATSQGRRLIPADSIGIPPLAIPDASQAIETDVYVETVPSARVVGFQSEKSSLHIPSEQESRKEESFSYFQRRNPGSHSQSEDLLKFMHPGQTLSSSSSGLQCQSAYPGSYTPYGFRNSVDIISDQIPSLPRSRENVKSVEPPVQLHRSINHVQTTKPLTSSFSPVPSRATLPLHSTTVPPPIDRASFNGFRNLREGVTEVLPRFGGIPSIISNRREKTGTDARLFFRQSDNIFTECTSENGQSSDLGIGTRAPGFSSLPTVRSAVGTSGMDSVIRPLRPIASRAAQTDFRREDMFRYGSLSISQDGAKWDPRTASFDKTEPHHLVNLREEPFPRLPQPRSSPVENSGSNLFNVMEDVLSPRIPTTPRREVSFGDTSVKSSYQRTPPFQLYDVVGSQKRGQSSPFCPDDPLEKTSDVTDYNRICEPAARGCFPTNGSQSYPGFMPLGKGMAEMYFSSGNGTDNNNHRSHRKLEQQQSYRQQKPKVGSKNLYPGTSDAKASGANNCWLGLGPPTTE